METKRIVKTLKYIGCGLCHRDTSQKITLIKGPTTYYCKECYMKLKKEGKI